MNQPSREAMAGKLQIYANKFSASPTPLIPGLSLLTFRRFPSILFYAFCAFSAFFVFFRGY
jgi:hypothetical protein